MAIQPQKLKIRIVKDIYYHFEGSTLYLSGALTLAVVPFFASILPRELKQSKSKDLVFDLSQITDIDSAGVTALFWLKKELKVESISVRIENPGELVNRKIELFRPEKFPEPVPEKGPGFFEYIGLRVHYFFANFLQDFLQLAANIFYFAFTDLFVKGKRRQGEFVNQALAIGVNAVLIISLMSYVIGFVLALQSAQQLRDFGANIYIVDLTVIAMMAQMGPLITAILVAGRSGSAIAAEIATMKVTSELDALHTMGLNPIRFVVVPKLYAALFTLPFLVLIASITGIAGGATAANMYLDITPEVFINRMADVMYNHDLISAFVKSQVYSGVIVLTGSFYGFRVKRGAEDVGKATTLAVVVSISLVILADSILGLLFY